MTTAMIRLCLLILCVILQEINGYCDHSVKWLNGFEPDHIYGMWYSIGYAQHTPDVSDKPPDIGCIVLHIDDVTEERRRQINDDYMTIMPHNHTAYNDVYRRQQWHLGIDGSWPNAPINIEKPTKNERFLRLVWYENGYPIEQTYYYAPETPALWKSELWKQGEWNREQPARRKYEVIRLLKATHTDLILHHCMDSGDGRVFSLILKRHPSWMSPWDWNETKKLFYKYDLPYVYRERAICAGSKAVVSSLLIVVSIFYFLL